VLGLVLAILLIPCHPLAGSVSARQADEFDPDLLAVLELTRTLESGDLERLHSLTEELSGRGGIWRARTNFIVGRFHAEKDDYHLAVGPLEIAANEYTLLGDHALLLLGKAYAGIRKYDKAAAAFGRISKLYPESPLNREALVLRGQAYIDNFEPCETIELLKPSLKGDYKARDNDIRFLLIRSMLDLGHTEPAVSLLKKIYISSPDTADAEEALDILRSLKSSNFTFSERLERANALKKYKKFERAERVYRSLLKEDPGNREILSALGESLFGARKYTHAAKVLGKTETAETWYLETLALYRSGQDEAFRRKLREGESRFPDLKSRFYRLQLAIGQDLRREGKYSKADKHFRRLLEEYPSNKIQTRWEIAWNHYRQGDFSQAARGFHELAGGDPALRPKETYWLARSLEQAGKSEQAASVLKGLAEASSTSFYGYLAMTLLPDNTVKLASYSPPGRPTSTLFDRILEMKLLGMNEDARQEIPLLLPKLDGMDEVLFLGHLSVELGEFRRVIGFSDPLARVNPTFKFLAYPKGFWNLLEQTSDQSGVDPYLLAAIIREESRFDPSAYSRAGAMGLMQLMPSTARRLQQDSSVQIRSESELFLPEKNIPIGSHYLGELVRHFDGNLVFAIAAYNAGRNAVKRWVDRAGHLPMDEFIEEISYKETRRYVKKVLRSYMEYSRLWGLTPPSLSGIVNPGEPRTF